ncbi:elongation factor 4 [Candidatus Nomurabacteria bacterium]|uniref:Elongation factor 4 n=1 Tax=candidate division WWE3 bacterium TaxID=2053526 RepID=A0A955DZD8_UNCKA|nr:translation elongation factor 4 [candidate division WWE3 bacterium]MCB9823813.1 elongation factor 4 [Candidatus Nomurabacteria bacterium]MCB9826781.1 elongation factor 4 [Candidatus Nomurabacteria bacterium]MCB9827608.1 elongation factor 4 [Candidatus Nomurabacteria bacterium]HXK52604.1 translation elongation factor 4 [bacterium]
MNHTANIRNFSIIAHIDHGKSTLADRLLDITGTIEKRQLKDQTLDSMELEREKGITIKLKAVRMNYTLDSIEYQLNLIDTPGHVDFSYEVSRSLAACEGAVLVVDATQGIQAQTVSNVYKAIDANLTIIPVINKVDLAGSNVEKTAQDLVDTFGFKHDEILQISAKTGLGIERLLSEIIKRVPAPKDTYDKNFRGLIFDTYYDEFLGVIALIKVEDGKIELQDVKNHRKIYLMATKAESDPESIGIMVPHRKEVGSLSAGEVGFISTGVKDIKTVRVGDTVTFKDIASATQQLEGYKEVKPFVFMSIYPIENDKYPELKDALEKLSLSDSALQYTAESNSALGFGYRCGFLGLLHADIVQERLEREYNLELISTTPSVEYTATLTTGETVKVKNPSEMPEPTRIQSVQEPWIILHIFSPATYTGGIITLCESRRGIMRKMEYPTQDTIMFEYELPLSELVNNFFDELKTISSGYASIDYDFLEYRNVKVIKMDILVHGAEVEPLAQIVLKDNAQAIGKKIINRLKDVIPRQQFAVAVQAAIGGKIIARETIPAMRKDVLSGIYGGHRERKDKLLERQKKGKKRMKRLGKVDIPQEAFRQVLSN